MSYNYAGSSSSYPTTIPILDDADLTVPAAADWAPGYEALADRTAYLAAREGDAAAFAWMTSARVPGAYTIEGVAAIQSAASGGIPIVCAFNATDKITRRIWNESGRSDSDADSLGGSGSLAAAVFGGSPTLVRADASGGTLRKSTDFGMTWVSAGTATAIIRGVHYFAAATKWVAITTVPDFQYSSTLTGAWSVGSGTPDGTNPRIASNATSCNAVFGSSTLNSARTTNGTAWTLVDLPGSAKNWSGIAYSTSQSKWMAVATDGTGAISTDDGVSWSAITLPVSSAQDVIAFGRYFVVLAKDALSTTGLTTVSLSEDGGTSWKTFAIDFDTAAATYTRLLLADGRIVAVGVDASSTELRLIYSGRIPAMPVP